MNFVTWFVQLDPRVQPLLELGFTFVVGFLILQLAALFPVLADYLGQYKTVIAVWLAGITAQLIQLELNKIPTNWDEVVFAAQKLLVEVVLVLLSFAALRHFKIKGYRALQ